MKLGDRINAVLAQLAVLPEAEAVATSDADVVSNGRGGHGKHGTTTAPPPRVHSQAVEWAERFRRLCIAAERDLEHARRGNRLHNPNDKRSPAYRAATSRIASREYEGCDATFVAFIEGRTTDGVRRIRLREGLNPDDGTRAERPLTSRQLPTHEEDQ